MRPWYTEHAHPSKVGNPARWTCYALQPLPPQHTPLPLASHKHLQDHVKNRCTLVSDIHTQSLHIFTGFAKLAWRSIKSLQLHASSLTCTLPCLPHQAGTRLEHLLSGASLLFGVCWSNGTSPECQSLSLSKKGFPSLSWDGLVMCLCPITFLKCDFSNSQKGKTSSCLTC